MTTSARNSMNELLKKVAETDGWQVNGNGSQDGTVVTTPAGKKMVFHHTVKERTVKNAASRLRRAGWQESQIEVDKQNDRQKRNSRAAKRYERLNDEVATLAERQLAEKGVTPGQDIGYGNTKVTVEALDADQAQSMLDGHERAVTQLANLTEAEVAAIKKHRTSGATLYMHNRPLSMASVNQFVAIIVNGKWMLTHQGIAISRGYEVAGRVVGAGFVIDGRHRLTAVVKAKDIPVAIEVRHDADPDTFRVLDSGRKRTSGDTLYAAGGFDRASTAKAAASIIGSLLALMKYGETGHYWDRSKKTMSNDDILDAKENIFATVKFDEVVERVAPVSKKVKLSPTALGMLYVMAPLAWEESPIEEFLTLLHDGVSSSDHPAIAAVRDWSAFAHDKERKTDTVSTVVKHLNVVMRAYNHWCQDRGWRAAWSQKLVLMAPYAPDMRVRSTASKWMKEVLG